MAKKYLEQPAKNVELVDKTAPNNIDQIIKETPAKAPEQITIENMPLNSLSDYVRYNREARKLNHKLKICRYPAKPCPIELHPKETIVFNRKDQPSNPLPVYLSNDIIHFDRTKPKDQLVPGKTYELPRCVVAYLAGKGRPDWKWFDNPDGSRETRKASMDPRFALRTIYKD